jgi:peptidyl-prolyl cis-trans isomerase SurA
MNIKKTVSKLALSVVISILCTQASFAKQTLDQIVAIVNSDVISRYELEAHTKLVVADIKSQPNAVLPSNDVLQEQVLNRMILDQIQVQLAEQYGIEVDSITVSQALQHMAQQKGQSVEQLKHSFESRGIPFDEYRKFVRNELIIQRLQSREVAQDLAISKSDIESFLSSPAGQDNSGTEYKLSHILLLTPEPPTPASLKQVQTQAEAIVASLKNGADFQKTAMTKSAGRQALNGGDLGWRNQGEIPTMFVNYIPNMQVGDIVGPIRSAGGFHIVKLQDKRTSTENSTETHVRHILISPNKNTSSDEAKAIVASIRKQLLKGADFAKIAAKKSQDMRSASKGGDLGWVNEESVLPQFYQAMSKLRNNEISEPFLTEDGWNLVQVLDRRTRNTSGEAAWNRALEILTIRKTNEAIESWTKRIRDEARVTILLPELNKQKQA